MKVAPLFIMFLLIFTVRSAAQDTPWLIASISENLTLANHGTNTIFRKNTDGDIRVNSLDGDFSILVSEKKIKWYAGVCLREQLFQFRDRIKRADYTEYGIYGEQHISYTFNDPSDLVARSYSLGILNQGSVFIKIGKKMASTGCVSRLFLIERYYAHYYSSDGTDSYAPEIPYTHDKRTFLLPSANLSVFLNYPLLSIKGTTVSAQLSIGKSIYSDWYQFRNYTWLGLGLGVGFNKHPKK